MAHVALYRRFRPRRFAEVVGQPHIVATLTHAVADETVGHAYLFSGPRGTGKTSTARILAKALNCTNLQGAEPCGECAACLAVDAGTSMDVHELDAASNRGIDDMKDLLRTVPLGTAGRTKVYVLDEVHMLTPAASAALLKTLEEPPGHVVFVLATTDPQKVLPTIRSRTQHLEFRLISAGLLDEHVRRVAAEAGVDVDDQTVDQVIRRGGGSARDTLSALDQVIAGGTVSDPDVPVATLVDALADRDPGRVVAAVAEAADHGVDARELAEAFARHLRDVFLVAVSDVPRSFTETQLAQLRHDGSRISAGVIVRAIEAVGTSLVELRQANDPRLALEVALLGVVTDPATVLVDELSERVAALEARLAGEGAPAPAAPAPAAPKPAEPQRDPAPTEVRPVPEVTPDRVVAATGGPADQARAALAGRTGAQPPQATVPAASPPPPPPPPPLSGVPKAEVPAAPGPDADPAPASEPEPDPDPPDQPVAEAVAAPPPPTDPSGIAEVWAAEVLPSVSRKAKSLYEAGDIELTDDGRLLVALPNGPHMARCEQFRRDVEAALAERLGRTVPIALMIAGEVAPPVERPEPGAASPATTAELGEHEVIDPDELVDATDVETDPVAQLQAAFPGSVLEEPPDEPLPGGDW